MSQESDRFYSHAGTLVQVFKWQVLGRLLFKGVIFAVLVVEGVTYAVQAIHH